jgi:hypothetical protein
LLAVPIAREVGLDRKGLRDRRWFGLVAPKGLPASPRQPPAREVAKKAADPDMTIGRSSLV